MILCLCKAVNDKAIDKAIDGGAKTVKEVSQKCEAGTACGACIADIKDRLQKKKDAGNDSR